MAVSSGFGVALLEDGREVRFRSPTPVSIVNASRGARHETRNEGLRLLDGSFVVSLRNVKRDGQKGAPGAAQYTAFTPGVGLICWDVAPELNQPFNYYRMAHSGIESTYSGALHVFAHSYLRNNLLLDLAVAQEALTENEFGFRAIVDLGQPEALGLLYPYLIGNGFSDSPGYAEIAFSQIDGLSEIVCRWRDSLDATVAEEKMSWSTTSKLPLSYARTYYVVGTAEIQSETNISQTHQGLTKAGTEELLDLQPGYTVIDSRFGAESTYTVSKDGKLPSDASISIKATGFPK